MRTLALIAAGLFAFGAGPSLSQEAAPEAAEQTAEAAADGAIALELNKLLPAEDACHAYLVVDNQTPGLLKELRLDVYLFDKGGVILHGVALQFSDVGPGRTRVVPFELPDLSCADIDRVLLNKVLACTDASGAAVAGCADRLVLTSRAEASFEY
jgi:hypothetical protein